MKIAAILQKTNVYLVKRGNKLKLLNSIFTERDGQRENT